MNTKEMIAEIIGKMMEESKNLGDISEAILNLRYPNGNPILAVLDEDQTRPTIENTGIHSTGDEYQYGFSAASAFYEGWRKTIQESE